MDGHFKQRIKSLIAVIIIISTLVILKNTINSNKSIASIKTETNTSSMLEVKAGSKIYETNNESTDRSLVSEVDNKQTKQFVEIKTEDTKPPDNLKNLDTKMLEDNIVINLSKPNDNGNDYEYTVENEDKTEILNFHAESGFYGYSYKVSNNPEDEADITANKLDESPIFIQNIDWTKDYYLHIRTFDNNLNYSESKTFKIHLPSNGVNVEYIDFNSNKTLAIPEKVSGMINDKYNVKNLNKDISGYTLVKTTENLEGLLQKETITVKYKYAKNANLSIKYIDKLTGKELISSTNLLGYEGKNIKLEPKDIKGYICETQLGNITMKGENQEISLLYNKLGNVVVSYIDEDTGLKLCNDEEKTYSYGNEYYTSSKEFTNYELTRASDNVNGVVDEDVKHVYYYYKPKFKVSIKYVDIDTNAVIGYDEIVTDKGSRIKIKLKEIEGYRLIKDINNPSDDENSSIIDEIINSISSEEELEESNLSDSLTTNERDNVSEEYEIVMNCDNSEYIIYYKKF